MQPQVFLEDRSHCTMCILPREHLLSAQKTSGVGRPLFVLQLLLLEGLTTGLMEVHKNSLSSRWQFALLLFFVRSFSVALGSLYVNVFLSKIV